MTPSLGMSDRLVTAVRTAYHAAVSQLRGTEAGRSLSRLLGRHLPMLKARLVRRYVTYDRSMQRLADEDLASPRPWKLPPVPPGLGGAERAVFIRLSRRYLQSDVRG